MVHKPLEDDVVRSHLASIPEDCREVFLLYGNSVRLVAEQGTHLINQMRANHALGILETLALGHGYLAGGLLASTIKGNDRILLQIECAGPIKGMSVEAWAVGAVRGYLHQVPIPVEKPLESFSLSPFFGPGFLTVTKLLESNKYPFSGQVMLQHGTIAKDLAEYFLISEQMRTVVSLSIQFDREGRAVGAGALFLQKLPGAGTSEIDELETLCASLPSMGAYLAKGKTCKAYVEEVFAPAKPHHLSTLPFAFSCPCERAQFARHLISLPVNEKDGILAEGPFPLTLHCLNCGSEYQFDKDELEALFA